jgi:anaerobic carbon-monoxide dehydrogenase iron sulfur subunit
MGLIFRVTADRCTGCGNCELACAFCHQTDGRPGQPRINVIRHGEQRGTPIVCLQCDEAACVAACPSGALRRNDRTGAIDLDSQRCIRCRACIGACPFGNLLWDDGAHLVEKCDLCGGQPWCVKFCPTGAITFRPFDSRAASSPTQDAGVGAVFGRCDLGTPKL